MSMLTSRSNQAVQFNPAYFDHATVDHLLTLRPPALPSTVVELRMLPLFELPAFKLGDARALFDSSATMGALEQALSILMDDPDYRGAIDDGGRDALMTSARNNLTTQLNDRSLNASVADNNRDVRDSVQLVTDPDGVMALEVAGTRLLAVTPSLLRGAGFDLIMQIAVVVLDMFALICTAIGIAIAHGSDLAKQIAEYIKGLGQSLVDWAGEILGKVGKWFSELRSSHGSPEWMSRVTTFAKQIVNFVIEALRQGWTNRNFINAIRYCFGCLFAGHWYKKAYYLLQLIASIILMIGTAGASIALKLGLALVQLGLLIWDWIVLEQMLHPKPQS